jgi:predicted nucleic acid-binding protein
LSVYVETSFIVSMYAFDIHSAAAQHLIQSTQEEFWLTTFVELEFVNALRQSVHRKQSSQSQVQASLNAFDQDVRAGFLRLKSLPEGVFVRARQLSRETMPLLNFRAADLLHVAAALELGADTFFTFDRQQAKVAEAMKLKINALP